MPVLIKAEWNAAGYYKTCDIKQQVNKHTVQYIYNYCTLLYSVGELALPLPAFLLCHFPIFTVVQWFRM